MSPINWSKTIVRGVVSMVTLGLGWGLLGAGSSAAARPIHRDAIVAGYVQLCGGPAPGRCWKGELGWCAPDCVTSDRVAAVDRRGRRVAVRKLHHGRFRFRLVPGHYVIELLADGKHVHGRVWRRKRETARAHRTTIVVFRFDVP